MFFNGMKLIENPMMVKGLAQNRTHKRRRINKKWRKRYGFTAIPDPNVYVMFGDTIVGHPQTLNKLRGEVRKCNLQT